MSLAELPVAVRRRVSNAISEPAVEAWPSTDFQLDNNDAELGANGEPAAPTDSQYLAVAVNQLRLARPELSAGWPVWDWQIWFFGIVSIGLGLALFTFPRIALPAALAILSLSFTSLAVLRLYCLWHGRNDRAGQGAICRSLTPTEDLPAYSVLVPLFREAGIARDLVSALQALDYPKTMLQILIVLEEADLATQHAVNQIGLPNHFEIIVVPAGAPQTKPRALNYALLKARGAFITVYDAEDVPEPDQLRRAIAAFANGPSNLACVQARLNVYNANKGWLTRQFTLEYTALFDWLLPALQALGLPVPLGGTSNHFRKAELVAVGGWDPFNVTEDADLGIRLARQGYAVEVLASTTWEEAPATFRAWMCQRTRWLKGWMQTYLVHNRQPMRLWRDLGAWQFFGLQMLMGGLLISALVHPWFYVFAGISAWHGTLLHVPSSLDGQVLWGLGLFNLVTGYVTGLGLAVTAVARRGWPHLAKHALIVPVYWLMISFAAYRALYQFASAPYFWEKTEHAARSGQDCTRSAVS